MVFQIEQNPQVGQDLPHVVYPPLGNLLAFVDLDFTNNYST